MGGEGIAAAGERKTPRWCSQAPVMKIEPWTVVEEERVVGGVAHGQERVEHGLWFSARGEGAAAKGHDHGGGRSG